jgi:predicted RNA methylase
MPEGDLSKISEPIPPEKGLIHIYEHCPQPEPYEYYDQKIQKLKIKLDKFDEVINHVEETSFVAIDQIKRNLKGVVSLIASLEEDFEKCGFILEDEGLDKTRILTEQIRQELFSLRNASSDYWQRLTEKKRKIFAPLREEIKNGKMSKEQLRIRLEEFLYKKETGSVPNWQVADWYINGILDINETPSRATELEKGMVFYDPTNVGGIMDLIDTIPIAATDVVYDIGAGLGRVPMVVNLLTGAKTRGVEYDPVYTQYAEEKKRALGLSEVVFINADARNVDYPDATIFYLYAPFGEDILKEVVKKLYDQAKQRKIKIALCGIGNFISLTTKVIGKNWLKVTHNEEGLRIYESTVGE